MGIEVMLNEPVLGKVVDHRYGMTTMEKAPDNIGSDEPTATQRQNTSHASFLPYAHLPDRVIVIRQSVHKGISGDRPYKYWITTRADNYEDYSS